MPGVLGEIQNERLNIKQVTSMVLSNFIGERSDMEPPVFLALT